MIDGAEPVKPGEQLHGQKAQALVCNSTLGKFVDGVKVTQEK